MVFQNYALFPNLTVEENMEFALKMQRVPKRNAVKKLPTWQNPCIEELFQAQSQRLIREDSVRESLLVELLYVSRRFS